MTKKRLLTIDEINTALNEAAAKLRERDPDMTVSTMTKEDAYVVKFEFLFDRST